MRWLPSREQLLRCTEEEIAPGALQLPQQTSCRRQFQPLECIGEMSRANTRSIRPNKEDDRMKGENRIATSSMLLTASGLQPRWLRRHQPLCGVDCVWHSSLTALSLIL